MYICSKFIPSMRDMVEFRITVRLSDDQIGILIKAHRCTYQREIYTASTKKIDRRQILKWCISFSKYYIIKHSACCINRDGVVLIKLNQDRQRIFILAICPA